jgi:hypothetical protein
MRQKLHVKTIPTKSKESVPSNSISVATIIENKPPAKDVLEYFKKKNSID